MIQNKNKKSQQRHILILCPAGGGDGSVAAVARRHTTEIAGYFNVIFVSDLLPSKETRGVIYKRVAPLKFTWFRRYAHVPNEISFALSVRRKIFNLSCQFRFSVIICHSHALATLAALPVKKKMGIPYSLVVHGDIFERPPETYDRRLTSFYEFVTPIAYKNADRIFAISPHIAECAKKRGANPETVKVIPNGIDPDEIGIKINDSKPGGILGVTGGELNILYVGRFSVEKGVDCLIKACAFLRESGIPFRLRMIGDGPQRIELQKLVMQLGIEKSVFFLGREHRKNLGEHYKAADVTCVPSLSEPQGLVVLESLISGTPVVGAATGGIPSMVKNNLNGILFPPGDARRLSKILEKLFRTPDQIRVWSRIARGTVFPRFSWSRIGGMLTTEIATFYNC